MPGFATRAIRAASRVPAAPQPPINVPIYQTSTFQVESASELAELLEFQRPGHSYSRYSNPTHEALELALAELEGAEACHVTASGMAAIHGALLSTVQAGDHVIAPRALYGGTYALLTGLLSRYGIGHTFADQTDASAVEAAITDRTRIIWLETIANPTTDVPDIAAIAALARPRGIAVMIDNTFASPYLCNPLALGADLVVHSVTKYVGGHSDLTGGAILATPSGSAAPATWSSTRVATRSRSRPSWRCAASRRWRCAWSVTRRPPSRWQPPSKGRRGSRACATRDSPRTRSVALSSGS